MRVTELKMMANCLGKPVDGSTLAVSPSEPNPLGTEDVGVVVGTVVVGDVVVLGEGAVVTGDEELVPPTTTGEEVDATVEYPPGPIACTETVYELPNVNPVMTQLTVGAFTEHDWPPAVAR